MPKSLPLLFALPLLVAIGCGESTVAPEDVFDPAKLQGTVDTSLPPHLQAKQEALATVFNLMIESGMDFEDMREEKAGVTVEESMEDFLEGTVELAQWDFNGKPSGDDVPVVLFLAEDSSGKNTRRVERVYTVLGSPGRITVSRK